MPDVLRAWKWARPTRAPVDAANHPIARRRCKLWLLAPRGCAGRHGRSAVVAAPRPGPRDYAVGTASRSPVRRATVEDEAALLDDVAHASEGGDIALGLPVQRHQVGVHAGGEAAGPPRAAESRRGVGGEGCEDLRKPEPGLLEEEVLVGGIVVRHVADVGP